MSGYLYSALSFKINCHAELGQPFKLCAQALPSTRNEGIMAATCLTGAGITPVGEEHLGKG